MLYFSKGSFTMPFKMWGGICKLKLVLLLKKKKKKWGGSALVQRTLQECRELSQWKSLVLLTYANSKIICLESKNTNNM
jgi:hypothetical protein